jgi:hypothetical protein
MVITILCGKIRSEARLFRYIYPLETLISLKEAQNERFDLTNFMKQTEKPQYELHLCSIEKQSR